MKTSQQVIGLPVISITDGNEIGRVKHLMINAAKGTVDFFVIDSAMPSLAGGVVPVEKVLGIGSDALTILEAADVSDIARIPAAIDLLQKNVTVLGTRVMTRKGKLQGVAGDIHVDEDNLCGIVGVEFVPALAAQASGIIPRNAVITFGQKLIVVEEDFAERLSAVPVALAEAGVCESAPSPEAISSGETLQSESSPVASPALQSVADAETMTPGSTPSLAPEQEISLEGLFSEEPTLAGAESLMADRRIQYLRGRRITRDITGTNGEVVAQSGDLIDEALMDRAGKAGCLVELVMNNEA